MCFDSLLIAPSSITEQLKIQLGGEGELEVDVRHAEGNFVSKVITGREI